MKNMFVDAAYQDSLSFSIHTIGILNVCPFHIYFQKVTIQYFLFVCLFIW